MFKGIVYKITNQLNGKMYVGQTIRDPKVRFNAHAREVRHGMLITKAMQKYGKENFSMIVLCECVSQDMLNMAESYFISKLQTLAPDGYNLCGGGGKKNVISDETRKKLSESHKGHIQNRGRKQSLDIRINMSKISGGQPIVAIDLKTLKITRYPYVNAVINDGLSQVSVRQALKGKRKHVNGSFFMYEKDFLKHANQSGSTEGNTSEHAPRLGSETAAAEYNLPTSLLLPSNFRGKATLEQLIEDYKILRSTTKVAKKHGLSSAAVRQRFLRNGIKVEKLA